MSQLLERLKSGIIEENPIFIQMLGMCPTLAVTTSAMGGLGMGLATTFVLVAANLVISILRKVIPSNVRIPAFIVVIASFVTMIELFLKGYVPSLYAQLGLFIPLIVVNCIILGRAESFASKNKPIPSIFDGLGMGLGFTVALTVIGVIREIFGDGNIFGMQIMPEFIPRITILVLAPGAFFVLGLLLAALNFVQNRRKKKVQGA